MAASTVCSTSGEARTPSAVVSSRWRACARASCPSAARLSPVRRSAGPTTGIRATTRTGSSATRPTVATTRVPATITPSATSCVFVERAMHPASQTVASRTRAWCGQIVTVQARSPLDRKRCPTPFLLLRDEADPAARFEHRAVGLVERDDLLESRLARDLLRRHPLLAQVLFDHLAVLDQDQRLGLEQRPYAGEPKADVGRRERQQAEHTDRKHEAGDGQVVLRHS